MMDNIMSELNHDHTKDKELDKNGMSKIKDQIEQQIANQPTSIPFKREPIDDIYLTEPYYENFTNLTIKDMEYIPEKGLGMTLNLLERPVIQGKGNIQGLYRGRVNRKMGGCTFID